MSLPFHLAFPTHDLKKARQFYIEGLGCQAGRESEHSLIINFFGHQIVAQKVSELPEKQKGIYPRHFGVLFETFEAWEAFKKRAKGNGLKFYQEPKARYKGEVLEHYTFFLEDPSHNLLEFKFYADPKAVFGHGEINRVGEEVR